MFNTEDFIEFFDDFVFADSNPFNLSYIETFKESEKIISKEIKKTIDLTEIESPIDLILNNNNFEIVDYYPKSILKRIFKKNKQLGFEGDENNFVFMSEKTSKIFKTNCKIYPLSEDDKVVIGKRSQLIIYQKENKLFGHVNQENIKTILIE